MEFITWPSLGIMAQCMVMNHFKPARQGAPALDVTLHTLHNTLHTLEPGSGGGEDTVSTVQLLDRVRPGRPLVVNVGSCS